MIVSNIMTIAQKELRHYFMSPLAYVVAAVFWLISGWLFVEILLGDRGIIQQIAFQEQLGVDLGAIDVATELLNSLLTILGTLSLLIVPLLSMGLYAKERQQGTLELLATSPITNWAIASGKLLAVTLFFIFLLLPCLIGEAIAYSAAEPPLPAAVPLLAHLGLILMVTGLLSLGMFISSLTNSSILAGMLTFGLILTLRMLDLITSNLGGWWGKSLQLVSPWESFHNLLQGILQIHDLVLLISYVVLGLFFTAQSVHLLRLNHQ